MHRSVRAPLLGMLFCAQPMSAQQYGLKTLSLEEGLPSAGINAVCEDAEGFLWVGTMQGAARSEGLRFETISAEQGLPIDHVTEVLASPGGAVWFGFGNGAVARWDHGEVNLISEGPGPSVRAMALLHGSLWWTSGEELCSWDRERGLEKHRVSDRACGNMRALAVATGDRLIAGTDSGLFVLDSDGWRQVELQDAPSSRVQSLHADARGVLVGTSDGFIELDNSLAPLPIEERTLGHYPIALPDANLFAVLRARNGDIWLGTATGLGRLSRAHGFPELTWIREANGLGNDIVRCLLQDRSGAIWAGTAFGGLTKYTSDAFVHFTDRDGLRARTVSALHRTIDGRLWIGTAGGGLASWDGKALRNHGTTEGITDPFILALGENVRGFLLVGCASKGLFVQQGDAFVRLGPEAGMNARRVHSIALDGEGRCWVGTEQGLYVDPGDGHFTQVDGLQHPVRGTVSNGDTLWAASSNGLFLLSTRSIPWRLRALPLPQVNMTSIARDGARNLWIGTEGHGLYRFRNGKLDSLTKADGLASNAVEQVLLDPVENLWLGTRRGVDMVELDALQDQVLGVKHYGAEEGFIGVECFRNACLLDSDSSLWFGTVRGATRYDPNRVLTDEREPLVHLTDLRLFYERPDWKPWCTGTDEHGLPEHLELPHDRNHLTFSFTGVSLAFPEKVRYRFILEGHDPDWSPITATDRVTYSNIPPGEYTFKVMARNASGIWTERPISYVFTIAPPFWQTNTFRVGGGGALLLGFFGFVRLRERRLRRDRERLERTVQRRTQELATEKERSEELLRNILPAATAQELKTKGHADAHRFEHCTVLFSDFKGFTSFSSRMDSDTLVGELHHYFGLFDQLCGQHGVEKIKTIGDAYMCAAGVPTPSRTHAMDTLLMAFGMLAAVNASNAERKAQGRQEWPVRIGMHSGPVVAGVVGTRKFAFDIWGDTVNLASRLESNGEAGHVNISGPVFAQVMPYIEAIPRGPIKVKGKGEVQMYFALRLKPMYSADERGWLANAALKQALGRA